MDDKKARGLYVYLSGPITNCPDFEERFRKAAEEVYFDGNTPINPAWLPTVLPDAEHDAYMAICYDLLLQADAIYMLPGWGKSAGAVKEYSWARELGLKRYYQGGLLDELTL